MSFESRTGANAGGRAVSGPRFSLRWVLGALVFAAVATGPSAATAQEAPEFSPPEVEPSVEELAYYESVIACAEVAGHTVSQSAVQPLTFDFFVGCTYEVIDPQGRAATLNLEWSRPTTRGTCNRPPAVSAGGQRTGVVNGSDSDPPFAANVGYNLEDTADEAVFVAAAETLVALARPLTGNCPAEQVTITCPPLAGYDTPEPQVGSSSGYIATCSYFGGESPSFDINAFWNVDFLGGEETRTWLCSDPERFLNGQGQVRVDGQAILVRYSINSSLAVDTDPATAAARSVAGQLTATAQSCDGAEIIDLDSIFTPIPPYLADAFSSDLIASSSPVSGVDRGTGAGTAVSSPPAPAVDGEDAGAVAGDGDGAIAPAASAAAATSNSGGSSRLRIVSIVLLVISVLGLILTFVMIRKPSRVRPKYEIIRIVAIVAVAISSVLVFSRSAPAAAIVGAIAVGIVLGVIQGRNLTVNTTEKGIYAQRSGLAIITFAASVVITQVAGLGQRTGAVNFGIALSFFSAAVAAGLYVGRQPNLDAARRTGLAGFLALVVGATTVLGVVGPDARAQDDPATAAVLEANAALVDVVDWDTIEVNGGLYAGFGKPPADISVPVGLTEPPPPLTRTVEWTVEPGRFVAVGSSTDFSVTETFTFAPRSDGVCCGVDYAATGTQSPVVEGEGQGGELTVDARLGDIQALAIDGEPGAFRFGGDLKRVPFGEAETFLGAGEGSDRCGRRVASVRAADDLAETGGEATIRSATRNGAAVDSVPLLAAVLTAPCELSGFTVAAALSAAPPPPEVADPARVGNGYECPLRRDLYGSLDAANDFPGVDTATLTDLYYEPNLAVCDNGALIAPPSFGQGGRGNQRHEILVDFVEPPSGEWDRGYNRWFTDDRVFGAVSTLAQPERVDACEIAADGVPVSPGEDGSCLSRTFHRLDGDLLVTITVDYSFADGPNTIVLAQMGWGTYRYRCHHCTPGDPAIATFLSGLHRFGVDWANDQYGDGEFGALPGSQQAEAEAERAAAAAAERENGISDDDVALGALLGLLGVSAVAISSLLESGGTLADVLDAARRDGDEGGRPAADQPVASTVIDENGEPMTAGEDGLYDWGGVRLSQEEVEERILDQREANASRDRRIRDIIREQDSEAAAAERFGDLRDRISAADANDELMQEIRDGWGRVDDLQRTLDRQDAAIARLETMDLAQNRRDQEYWDNPINWLGEVASSFNDGVWDDIHSLARPDGENAIILMGQGIYGTARDIGIALRGALDSVAAAAADQPELGTVLWETVRDTAYDTTVGLVSGDPGSYDHLVEASDTIATVGALAREHAGTIVQALTGIDQLIASMDPDLPLHDRLQHYAGFALEAMMFGSGWIDEGLDAARALDAVTDVGRGADAATDVGRAADAATDVGRAADAASPLPRDAWVRGLPEGSVIERSVLHEIGYSQAQIDELARIARKHNIQIGSRSTNMDSMHWIRDGKALPKPMEIKSKTIGALDTYIGANKADEGLVGYFLPTEPNMSQIPVELQSAVRQRYQQRLFEYIELRPQVDDLLRGNTVVERNGLLYRVTSKGEVPFAGDIDLRYLRNPDGSHISGEKFLEVMDDLKKSGAGIQHGPETDVINALTKGLRPGSPEWHEAYSKAVKLHANLESNVATGKDILMHMGTDGVLRRGATPQRLPIVKQS